MKARLGRSGLEEKKGLAMPRRSVVLTAAVVLFLAVALGLAALLVGNRQSSPVNAGAALVGGPFTLVNQDGKTVTEKDFLGRYMLVFFGYTYCPDICPTELQVMTAALEAMGEEGKKIQPVFISVDPARDTPEIMKSYVENFSGGLVGLTGTPEQIAGAAKAYRAYYAKAGEGEDYKMDHSTIIYLMGPDGKFVKHFTFTSDAAKLAQELKALVITSP
jgi:cytochrome oxidase Cu insertion factor (SCO1/SenC/PrrC family)